MSDHDHSTTRWGSSRWGGGKRALWFVALGLGVLIAVLSGLLAVLLGHPENPVLTFCIVAVAALPAGTALGWAIGVDRSSLTGAVSRPEDSVESSWYSTAAAGVFTDLLLVCGLGAALFSFTAITAPVGLCLAAVVAIAMLDFGARYFWLRKIAAS